MSRKGLFKNVLKPDPAISILMGIGTDNYFVDTMINGTKQLYKVSSLDELKKCKINKVIQELNVLVTGAAASRPDEIIIFIDVITNGLLKVELSELVKSSNTKVKTRIAVTSNRMFSDTILVITSKETTDIYPSFYPFHHSILGAIKIDPESIPKPPSLAINFK